MLHERNHQPAYTVMLDHATRTSLANKYERGEAKLILDWHVERISWSWSAILRMHGSIYYVGKITVRTCFYSLHQWGKIKKETSPRKSWESSLSNWRLQVFIQNHDTFARKTFFVWELGVQCTLKWKTEIEWSNICRGTGNLKKAKNSLIATSHGDRTCRLNRKGI